MALGRKCSWYEFSCELLDERNIFKYFINGKHAVSCLDAGREQRHRFRRAGCCDSTFSTGDR